MESDKFYLMSSQLLQISFGTALNILVDKLADQVLNFDTMAEWECLTDV